MVKLEKYFTSYQMRRNNDFYPTPGYATKLLLQQVRLSGNILELCSGNNAIANELKGLCHFNQNNKVITNDIDTSFKSDYHYDATNLEQMIRLKREIGTINWIVTNPPF